jgi:hypothetical protein
VVARLRGRFEEGAGHPKIDGVAVLGSRQANAAYPIGYDYTNAVIDQGLVRDIVH